jgi:hypothetical protein
LDTTGGIDSVDLRDLRGCGGKGGYRRRISEAGGITLAFAEQGGSH